MIYFDNNATTQLAPEVFEAMRPFLQGSFGNPSSAYSLSDEAKRTIANTRESVAKLLGAADQHEIVFTSGGTESDNWAILGALEADPAKRHIITTRVEHEAVRKLCHKLERQNYRVTWLEVDGSGALDLDHLSSALCDDTAIVSTMSANNETGILFPVREIGEIVKGRSKALFHVDGVNAVGKIPVDLNTTQIDLFSLSAHKFHGPKGVGALYIRDGVKLPSLLIGGGQESGQRAGTEAVHQIAGLGAAASLAIDLTVTDEIRQLRDNLEHKLLSTIPNTYVNGTADPSKRLPNTTNISFENTNGEMILHRLDENSFCVSTGSACNSQERTASPVLQAMNIPYSRAMGSIRFSLGRFNTDAEIQSLLSILPAIIAELRTLAGSS
ncbi:MAG: aminotransferase class V-fold PLP-dependent enzyme [Pyrinomonadaceae bacterium]